MLRHHTGSGRRSVIPADWSAHHRGVVRQTWTGGCTIHHPGQAPASGTLDPESGEYPPAAAAAAHFTGACRVQVQLTTGQSESAGEQVTVAGYLVVVDQSADAVKVDDVVTITRVDDNGDPTLFGRRLTVTGVARGTLTWERDLTCVDTSE